MARKQKNAPVEKERAAGDYYKLNTKALDDLVSADESNSPQVSEAELRKYRAGTKKKIPMWIKVVLIKAWFAAALCWFFIIGTPFIDALDTIVVTGIVYGFVIDLLVNNVLRFIEETPGSNDRWLLVSKKGFASLLWNVIYGLVLMILIVKSYELLNVVINAIRGAQPVDGRMPTAVPVEPILFGIFAMAWDVLFLKMKAMMGRIVADAKAKVSSGR